MYSKCGDVFYSFVRILISFFDSALLESLTYYAFVGILKDPIQYCILQHRKAYDIGMKTGNISDAFFNLAFMIPRMLDAGENLLAVKREILFYQQLAEKHNHPGELKLKEDFSF